MHELSIAMSILDMAEEEAGRRSAEVDVIHVKLGALSGVAKEALLSAYDLARTETTLPIGAVDHRGSARDDLLPALSSPAQRSFYPAIVVQRVRNPIVGNPAGP